MQFVYELETYAVFGNNFHITSCVKGIAMLCVSDNVVSVFTVQSTTRYTPPFPLDAHTNAEYASRVVVRSFVGDICQPETIERAFVDGGVVDCVFHCAAYVNFQFPPDLDELERVNLMGKSLHNKKKIQKPAARKMTRHNPFSTFTHAHKICRHPSHRRSVSPVQCRASGLQQYGRSHIATVPRTRHVCGHHQPDREQGSDAQHR